MKKIFLYFLLAVVIFAVLVLVGIPLFFHSCEFIQEYSYYSHKENFITTEGTVDYISYSEDGTEMYIGFSDQTSPLSYATFQIAGDNFKIVHSNDIESKLKIGDRISFMFAPEYFGDGYLIPIVSITVNDEVLLEFDEGYENLMKWLVTDRLS